MISFRVRSRLVSGGTLDPVCRAPDWVLHSYGRVRPYVRWDLPIPPPGADSAIDTFFGQSDEAVEPLRLLRCTFGLLLGNLGGSKSRYFNKTSTKMSA